MADETKSFEDLDARQSARDLTTHVYSLCQREPLNRDFALSDQIKRAALSVMNNIAEGWESLHPAEKLRFYNVARRSCGEVRSMSYVLLDNRFITSTEQLDLRDRAIRPGKLISGLMRATERRK